MPNHGLAALVAPSSADDFLKDFWNQKPFCVHGLDQTIRPLTALPFLQSLEALLDSWPRAIQAHLPDIEDESSSIDTTPKDARKLFANNMGLLFNDVQNISAELQNWLGAIRNDLGLPTSTYGRCIVYATPDGKGTATHFDQNVNFVLQLHGTKTWWLAPNTSVENPTERHTLGQPLDPELASYARHEMPNAMPASAQKIVLQPGSMLFVPRGFWHRTEATGEALALNFTFSQPTWIDLLSLALRSRLSLSTQWRALADGVTAASAAKRNQARDEFDFLLRELIADLPNWQATDILGATEGDFGDDLLS